MATRLGVSLWLFAITANSYGESGSIALETLTKQDHAQKAKQKARQVWFSDRFANSSHCECHYKTKYHCPFRCMLAAFLLQISFE